MKVTIFYIGLSCLVATSLAYQKPAAPAAAAAAPNAPVATMAPPPTLTQDLEEITRFVPMKMIMKLITRYLLNDEEFQAVVRSINSYNAFMVRMRIRSQPEIMMFQNWVRSQLMLSGGSLEMDESMEVKLFRSTPYWANSVYGWQGFINEFMSYYPQELIRAHIDMKVAQGGIFAQFWTRLTALKPVYERILNFPETLRFIDQLQAIGLDIHQLDLLIRTQFNWLNPPTGTGAEVMPQQAGIAYSNSAAPAGAVAVAPAAVVG